MKKHILPILIFSLLFAVPLLEARTFYVNISNPSCSDGGEGNVSLPYCGFAMGLSNLTGGDVMVVGAGFYNNTGGYAISNKNYQPKATVVLAEGATISSAVAYFIPNNVSGRYQNTSNSSQPGLWNASYVTSSNIWHGAFNDTKASLFSYSNLADLISSSVDGFYYNSTSDQLYLRLPVRGGNPNSMSFLFYYQYFQMTNVTNLEFQNLHYAGGYKCLYIINSKNLTFRNADLVACGQHYASIQSGSQDIQILDSHIEEIKPDSWNWSLMKGSRMESTGLYTFNTTGNILFQNNTIHGIFNGIGTYTLNSTGDRNLSWIRNNVYDIDDDGLEIEEYCYGSLIQGNKVWDATKTLSVTPANASREQCRVLDNILKADKSVIGFSSGHVVGADTNYSIINFLFEGNTFIGWGSDVIYSRTSQFTHPELNTTWWNNIFYSNGSDRLVENSGLASDGVLFDYNLYYRPNNGTLFISWNNASSTVEYADLNTARLASPTWDNNSAEGSPLFLSVDPLSPLFAQPAYNSPACNMSSEGSYVGAVACQSSPVVPPSPSSGGYCSPIMTAILALCTFGFLGLFLLIVYKTGAGGDGGVIEIFVAIIIIGVVLVPLIVSVCL